MDIHYQIESLPWTKWDRIPTKSRGWMEIRSIRRPGREFWNLWREYKVEMKDAGIMVFNRTGEPEDWFVEQWVEAGKRPRVRVSVMRERRVLTQRKAYTTDVLRNSALVRGQK